jgi:hypothetical protein
VTLVLIDNACLHFAEPTEDTPDLTFGASSTTYEQCTAEHFDVITRQRLIPVEELGPAILEPITDWAVLAPLWRRCTLSILITIITTTTASATTPAAITAVAIRVRIRIIHTISGTIATIWW